MAGVTPLYRGRSDCGRVEVAAGLEPAAGPLLLCASVGPGSMAAARLRAKRSLTAITSGASEYRISRYRSAVARPAGICWRRAMASTGRRAPPRIEGLPAEEASIYGPGKRSYRRDELLSWPD